MVRRFRDSTNAIDQRVQERTTQTNDTASKGQATNEGLPLLVASHASVGKTEKREGPQVYPEATELA